MTFALRALVFAGAFALCACAGATRNERTFTADISRDPVAGCERVVYSSATTDSRTLACADVIDIWQ